MNLKTQEALSLFAANTQAIKRGYIWRDNISRRLSALLYAQKNAPINVGAIHQCYKLIKQNTGIFSMFRRNMAMCVATLLSLSENPQEVFSKTLEVYALLKEAKFRESDFLVMAAYQIAVGAEDYSNTISRAKAFYDDMKAHHRFYTGRDDYIFAAMLGLSDLDIAAGAARIEELYLRLKGEFADKNSVQTLVQILVLGGNSEDTAIRVLELRDALKAQKLRLDRTYILPILGILALLPVDISTLVQDLKEAKAFLRKQKGFGRLSVASDELLLFGAAIIAEEYASHINNDILTAMLSTSIASIIIAQEAAAVSASSSAASSS
ncbi:MAG: DUF4003 domain-containing protein [Oscillospiraceae bacterium]|jgi:hypothetical protein|nr:DUF4003 domain-containing protein [Oscillospiraceae bacterium]